MSKKNITLEWPRPIHKADEKPAEVVRQGPVLREKRNNILLFRVLHQKHIEAQNA